jgi:hypothetical protein
LTGRLGVPVLIENRALRGAGFCQYLVISLEDLIQSKEALERQKDLLMAKELRAIAAKRAKYQLTAKKPKP